MRHVKILGLGAVLALAMGALAATSASAAFPEFGHCNKVMAGTGKYTDSECTHKGTGEFEFARLPSEEKTNKFTSSIGEVFIEFPKGTFSVSCLKGTNEGETSPFQNSTHVKMVLKFTKCKSSGGKCSSPGAGEEEIVTKRLKGWLIYVEKEPGEMKRAGMFVDPETGPFAEFECGLLTTVTILKNEGAITSRCLAGEITPINKPVEQFALTFSIVEKKQEITEFFYLGALQVCQLEALVEGKTEPVNISFVDTITWEGKEKIEVKA